MISQNLINQVKNLTPSEKMDLIAAILNSEPDQDNYGQFIFYTGLTEDDDGTVIEFEG